MRSGSASTASDRRPTSSARSPSTWAGACSPSPAPAIARGRSSRVGWGRSGRARRTTICAPVGLREQRFCGSAMAAVTVKRLDEFDAIFGGGMRRVRAGLGVTSFGMQVNELPPDFSMYPSHDHSHDDQEEVYVTLG